MFTLREIYSFVKSASQDNYNREMQRAQGIYKNRDGSFNNSAYLTMEGGSYDAAKDPASPHYKGRTSQQPAQNSGIQRQRQWLDEQLTDTKQQAIDEFNAGAGKDLYGALQEANNLDFTVAGNADKRLAAANEYRRAQEAYLKQNYHTSDRYKQLAAMSKQLNKAMRDPRNKELREAYFAAKKSYKELPTAMAQAAPPAAASSNSPSSTASTPAYTQGTGAVWNAVQTTADAVAANRTQPSGENFYGANFGTSVQPYAQHSAPSSPLDSLTLDNFGNYTQQHISPANVTLGNLGTYLQQQGPQQVQQYNTAPDYNQLFNQALSQYNGNNGFPSPYDYNSFGSRGLIR